MRELLVRTISGLVYAALICFASIYSKETFYLLFYIFMMLCLIEFKKLIKLSYKWTFVVATLIYLRFLQLDFIDQRLVQLLLIVSFFVPMIYQLFKSKIALTSSKLGPYFLALAYIVIPFVTLTQIPFEDHVYTPYTIVSIFVLIWVSDTFAYLVGSTMGRTKLYQKISPNKTVEGAAGGLIGAIGAAVVIAYYNTELTMTHWIIVAIIVFSFGLLGDLIESKFKREAGVKDSSNLIPGHGGFLDRLDSIIFAAPFVYVYLHVI